MANQLVLPPDVNALRSWSNTRNSARLCVLCGWLGIISMDVPLLGIQPRPDHLFRLPVDAVRSEHLHELVHVG